MERELLGKSELGALARVVLQQVGQTQQEHNGGCRGHIAAEHGSADGGAVEHCDIHMELQQVIQCAYHVFGAVPDGDRGAYRERKQPHENTLDEHFFEVAGKFRIRLRDRRKLLFGEGAAVQCGNGVQHLLAGTVAVHHENTAGAPVGFRMLDEIQAAEKVCDTARLFLGEGIVAAAYSQPVMCVVDRGESHS